MPVKKSYKITNLKVLRAMSRLRQKEVARELGITPNWLSMVECERRMPSLKMLGKLSEMYQAKIEVVFDSWYEPEEPDRD